MENGTGAAAAPFVSAPPPPPALPPQAHLNAAAFHAAAAAATTAAGGGGVAHFQEALMSRMGRPFGLTVRRPLNSTVPRKLNDKKQLQTAEMKDLAASSPFLGLGRAAAAAAAGGTTTTPMEGFPGLPFLSHMAAAAGAGGGQPPPFLHHFGHPFTAFRPFLSTTTSTASAASAFQPPVTRDKKGSSPTLFSPGQNLFPRSSTGKSIYESSQTVWSAHAPPARPNGAELTSPHPRHHTTCRAIDCIVDKQMSIVSPQALRAALHLPPLLLPQQVERWTRTQTRARPQTDMPLAALDRSHPSQWIATPPPTTSEALLPKVSLLNCLCAHKRIKSSIRGEREDVGHNFSP